jgi:hypothetical protein
MIKPLDQTVGSPPPRRLDPGACLWSCGVGRCLALCQNPFGPPRPATPRGAQGSGGTGASARHPAGDAGGNWSSIYVKAARRC